MLENPLLPKNKVTDELTSSDKTVFAMERMGVMPLPAAKSTIFLILEALSAQSKISRPESWFLGHKRKPRLWCRAIEMPCVS